MQVNVPCNVMDLLNVMEVISEFFYFVIQILIRCSEMERLGIGLGHLRDIRVQCGVAAWILMLYVPLLVLRTSLRMN